MFLLLLLVAISLYRGYVNMKFELSIQKNQNPFN